MQEFRNRHTGGHHWHVHKIEHVGRVADQTKAARNAQAASGFHCGERGDDRAGRGTEQDRAHTKPDLDGAIDIVEPRHQEDQQTADQQAARCIPSQMLEGHRRQTAEQEDQIVRREQEVRREQYVLAKYGERAGGKPHAEDAETDPAMQDSEAEYGVEQHFMLQGP